MGTRIPDFDTWQAGYGGATVTVYVAGTTTKANIYSDEDLTVAIANPQTLESLTQNGVNYGKWAQPVYVGGPVELKINAIDRSGVIRPPLTTLEDQDASKATVTSADGTEAVALEDVVARTIHALDHGELGSSAATNTATLLAAIGVAAGKGGGRVIIPAGSFAFTQLTLSAGVVLEGQGRGVTTLQSQTADAVITINGDGAGLSRLTLDGVNGTAGSTGLFSKANDEIVLDDVEVKRFETGIHAKGGRRSRWRDLTIDTCGTGAKLTGDGDAGGGADGDEWANNRWDGGRVRHCTTAGVVLENVDLPCRHNRLTGIGFEDNTGTAVKIVGARYSKFMGCWWDGNTANLSVEDHASDDESGTVIGLVIAHGRINGGEVEFTGDCQDVILDMLELSGIEVTLTLPGNAILVRDCDEEDVTLEGQGIKWTRWRSINSGESAGLTTDATATKAWSMELVPGQVVLATAKVIGNQRNGSNTAEYLVAVSAKRAGATLAYDTQTANFTVGDIVTGQTSGARARIIADSDSGATGTLTLRDIEGTFEDNEIITGASGGSATVNGSLSDPTVSLLGSNTHLRSVREDVSGWDCAFAANGPELELRVTGAASTTIEWTVEVQVTST